MMAHRERVGERGSMQLWRWSVRSAVQPDDAVFVVRFGVGITLLDGGIHERGDSITPIRRSLVVVRMRRRPDRRVPAKPTSGNIWQPEQDDKQRVLNAHAV